MGCGNTKTDPKSDKFALTVYNPEHSKHKKIKRDNSLFQRKNTKEDYNNLQKDQMKPESQNFLKLKEEAQIASTIKWKNLVIDQRTYFDLLNAIEKNQNLENFSMESIEIENALDTFISLARTLMKITKLKTLEFICLSNLGNKKAKSIAKIMDACTSIERLVLNEIELDEEDASYLGFIFKNLSTSLIYFELRLIFFNSDSIRELLEGLHNNNTIEELVLNKINLSEEILSVLIKAISTNKCLSRLDISNNPIKKGTFAFKEFELKNLKTLQLNNCDIDDESLLYLFEGIRSNDNINLLELNNNLITAYSVKIFVMFFEENKSLINMYILSNQITKRDLMAKLNDEDLVKIVSEI